MSQSPLAFVAINASGAQMPGQVDAQRALFVGQRHGPSYEAGYGKALFAGANPTPVTTSIGLATTYLGLCLSNPAGSGKNLAVQNVSGALLVAPSTITTFSLIAGFAAGGVTVHTTALTPLSTFLGSGAAPVGLIDSACTLVGTPAYARVLGQTPTATTSLMFSVNIDGSIIVPPGGYIAIGSNIASPASGFLGSILWEENPQ